MSVQTARRVANLKTPASIIPSGRQRAVPSAGYKLAQRLFPPPGRAPTGGVAPVIAAQSTS